MFNADELKQIRLEIAEPNITDEEIQAQYKRQDHEPSIADRIAEMEASDAETGEHQEATAQDYLEWATEEFIANHEDYIND